MGITTFTLHFSSYFEAQNFPVITAKWSKLRPFPPLYSTNLLVGFTRKFRHLEQTSLGISHYLSLAMVTIIIPSWDLWQLQYTELSIYKLDWVVCSYMRANNFRIHARAHLRTSLLYCILFNIVLSKLMQQKNLHVIESQQLAIKMQVLKCLLLAVCAGGKEGIDNWS